MRNFIYVLALALVMAGCGGDENPPNPNNSGSGNSGSGNSGSGNSSTKTYTITVTNNGNGIASASETTSEAGSTITLTATPNSGYVFDKWVVLNGAVTLSSGNPVTFIMPAELVSIKAEFKMATSLPIPSPNALDGITGAGDMASSAISYVGAFWKHDQTGERVIKISNPKSSTWSAEVAWYGPGWDPENLDGVVLALGGSPDAAIYTYNPGDAENYQVNGVATKVNDVVATGGDIIFRIGLTKPFAAYDATTNPARYAVVVLTYGSGFSGKQKIFLRQGEGADYVMRPGDKSSGNLKIYKFSPYNLTDPNSNVQTNYNAMTSTATGVLAVNGGAFVDYPTQAGYFFQFNTRQAFHPATPRNFQNWSKNYGTAPWYSPGNACPEGYHPPNIMEYINNSLTFGRSVGGYYADGWFDRRAITHQFVDSGSTNGDKTAVSVNNSNVAYSGRLFFNATTTSESYNASLFFPAAGFRGDRIDMYGNRVDGALHGAGSYGRYWCASRNTGTSWYLRINISNSTLGSNAYSDYSLNTAGYSIRCARIE